MKCDDCAQRAESCRMQDGTITNESKYINKVIEKLLKGITAAHVHYFGNLFKIFLY